MHPIAILLLLVVAVLFLIEVANGTAPECAADAYGVWSCE